MQLAPQRMTTLPSSTVSFTRPVSGIPTPTPAFFMAQAIPANLAFSYCSFTARRVSTRPVELSTICPLGSTSPGRMALRMRISQGEMPTLSAIRFRTVSTAKQVWVTPKPRKAPAGGLLV